MRGKIERVNPSLEIDEAIDLHITGWIAQRIGWGLMLVVLVLAALGLFGDGILSREQLVRGDTALTFERYARRGSDTELQVTTPVVDGRLCIVLSSEFTRAFEIRQITPEPIGQWFDDGNTAFDFSGDGRGNITFFMEVRRGATGTMESVVSVNDRRFTLHQYIYP